VTLSGLPASLSTLIADRQAVLPCDFGLLPLLRSLDLIGELTPPEELINLGEEVCYRWFQNHEQYENS
jgi:hypothetical protein